MGAFVSFVIMMYGMKTAAEGIMEGNNGKILSGAITAFTGGYGMTAGAGAAGTAAGSQTATQLGQTAGVDAAAGSIGQVGTNAIAGTAGGLSGSAGTLLDAGALAQAAPTNYVQLASGAGAGAGTAAGAGAGSAIGGQPLLGGSENYVNAAEFGGGGSAGFDASQPSLIDKMNLGATPPKAEPSLFDKFESFSKGNPGTMKAGGGLLQGYGNYLTGKDEQRWLSKENDKKYRRDEKNREAGDVKFLNNWTYDKRSGRFVER